MHLQLYFLIAICTIPNTAVPSGFGFWKHKKLDYLMRIREYKINQLTSRGSVGLNNMATLMSQLEDVIQRSKSDMSVGEEIMTTIPQLKYDILELDDIRVKPMPNSEQDNLFDAIMKSVRKPHNVPEDSQDITRVITTAINENLSPVTTETSSATPLEQMTWPEYHRYSHQRRALKRFQLFMNRIHDLLAEDKLHEAINHKSLSDTTNAASQVVLQETDINRLYDFGIDDEEEPNEPPTADTMEKADDTMNQILKRLFFWYEEERKHLEEQLKRAKELDVINSNLKHRGLNRHAYLLSRNLKKKLSEHVRETSNVETRDTSSSQRFETPMLHHPRTLMRLSDSFTDVATPIDTKDTESTHQPKVRKTRATLPGQRSVISITLPESTGELLVVETTKKPDTDTTDTGKNPYSLQDFIKFQNNKNKLPPITSDELDEILREIENEDTSQITLSSQTTQAPVYDVLLDQLNKANIQSLNDDTTDSNDSDAVDPKDTSSETGKSTNEDSRIVHIKVSPDIGDDLVAQYIKNTVPEVDEDFIDAAIQMSKPNRPDLREMIKNPNQYTIFKPELVELSKHIYAKRIVNNVKEKIRDLIVQTPIIVDTNDDIPKTPQSILVVNSNSKMIIDPPNAGNTNDLATLLKLGLTDHAIRKINKDLEQFIDKTHNTVETIGMITRNNNRWRLTRFPVY